MDIKGFAEPLIWLGILVANVAALVKWNRSFMKKKEFLDQCKKCKEEFQVADDEVKSDIKSIKTALLEEEKDLKTLAVIQIAMAHHVGMDKEKIDQFKDAIVNGTDISSLL